MQTGKGRFGARAAEESHLQQAAVAIALQVGPNAHWAHDLQVGQDQEQSIGSHDHWLAAQFSSELEWFDLDQVDRG